MIRRASSIKYPFRTRRVLHQTLATLVPTTPQTLVEKIVQKYAVGIQPGQLVKAGDFVSIQPEHVMTHDNTGAVISK